MVEQAYVRLSEQLAYPPTVAKTSSVARRVVDGWERRDTVPEAQPAAAQASNDRTAQRTIEAAVCQMLTP